MAIFPLAERALRRALNAAGIESRWVRTKIAEQHVFDARGTGELPAVVLLHGIGAAASAFAPLIHKLRPRVRRVIAPDAPGHGLSKVPARPLTPETLFEAMSEVLDGMLDEPAIVFGNSLGGAVALSYGMARPDRSRGLFLASPAGAFMDAEELDAFLRLFHLRSRADGRAFLEKIYHRPPGSPRSSPARSSASSRATWSRASPARCARSTSSPGSSSAPSRCPSTSSGAARSASCPGPTSPSSSRASPTTRPSRSPRASATARTSTTPG